MIFLLAASGGAAEESHSIETEVDIPVDVRDLLSQGGKCTSELNFSCAKLAYELALEKLVKYKKRQEKTLSPAARKKLEDIEAGLLFSLGISLSYLDMEVESGEKLEEAFLLKPELEYKKMSFSPGLCAKIEAARKRAEVKRIALRKSAQLAIEEKAQREAEAAKEPPATPSVIAAPPEKIAPKPKGLHTIYIGGGQPLLPAGDDSTAFRKGFYSRNGYRYRFDYGLTAGSDFSFFWLTAGDAGDLYSYSLSATVGYTFVLKGLEFGANGNIGYSLLQKSADESEITGVLLAGAKGLFAARFPKWLYYGVSVAPQWYLFSNANSFVLCTQFEVGLSF